MSIQAPFSNGCSSIYRSSDSYVVGTADYNRWLNCELGNGGAGIDNGVWNGGTTVETVKGLDVVINNMLDNGSGVIGVNTVDNTAKTVTETIINPVNDTGQKILETTSKNPLLTIGIVFAVALLLFKK